MKRCGRIPPPTVQLERGEKSGYVWAPRGAHVNTNPNAKTKHNTHPSRPAPTHKRAHVGTHVGTFLCVNSEQRVSFPPRMNDVLYTPDCRSAPTLLSLLLPPMPACYYSFTICRCVLRIGVWVVHPQHTAARRRLFILISLDFTRTPEFFGDSVAGGGLHVQLIPTNPFG